MKLLNYIRIKLGKCNHFFAYPQTALLLALSNSSNQVSREFKTRMHGHLADRQTETHHTHSFDCQLLRLTSCHPRHAGQVHNYQENSALSVTTSG